MEVIEKNGKRIMVLNYNDKLNYDDLEEFKNTRGIGIIHASTGHENVPKLACKQLGLQQEWLSGYSTSSVVELALLLTLLASRTQKLVSKTDLSHNFCFKKGTELKDKNAVVIGSLGRIGSELVSVLDSLGMIVFKYDSKKILGFSESLLLTILNKADFVYLCVNGEDNKHFFSREYFLACKKQPVLINLVRGTLINEKLLVEALNKKWISSYYVDDLLRPRFHDSLNVFYTTHHGANTIESRERQAIGVRKLINQMFMPKK
ncbi:MAG TPA: hypothetical protein ENH90_01905 [bacterium]|nr:hypothetical protein [bacterium]